MKKDKFRDSIIVALKEMPIVQFACKKTGISRASYYRWRKESPNFAKEANEAITEGESLISDLSETQLVNLIKDRNFPAIQLWLKHHHPKYANKIELTGNLNIKEEPLTPEQQQLIEKSLTLAGILLNNSQKYDSGVKESPSRDKPRNNKGSS